MAKKVLVVDDEQKIIEVLKSFLESKGFLVYSAENGRRALEIFDREAISFIILDLMMPEMSGEEVCDRIRKKSMVPIIMLTAKSEEADMLRGLGIGADDFVTKPFSLKALYARMEAVLRRTAEAPDLLPAKRSYSNGDLTIDFESRSVCKQSEEVKLTPNEYKLLTVLVQYPNKVFTREELTAISKISGRSWKPM